MLLPRIVPPSVRSAGDKSTDKLPVSIITFPNMYLIYPPFYIVTQLYLLAELGNHVERWMCMYK